MRWRRSRRRFFGFPQRDVTIIGVTGTKGKTTVAETACSVMNRMGLPCGVIGSNGAAYAGKHVGTSNTTPESYELMRLFRAMRDEGVRYVVMEVSSQALARHRVDGITFDTAEFTNLSPTTSAPRSTRTMPTTGQQEAVVRPVPPRHLQRPTTRSGVHDGGQSLRKESPMPFTVRRNLRAERVNILKAGTCSVWSSRRPATTYHIRMPGEYNVYNALAVVALVGRYTARTCELAEALSYVTVAGAVRGAAGRDVPGCTVVLDFAHNSISMNALLQTARSYDPAASSPCSAPAAAPECAATSWGRRWPKGPIWPLLPPTTRIGTTRRRSLRTLPPASAPAAAPMWASWTAGRRCAMRMEQLCPGDMLLLCGKGREGYQLVQGKKIPYDEEETVRSCARELLESRPQAL